MDPKAKAFEYKPKPRIGFKLISTVAAVLVLTLLLLFILSQRGDSGHSFSIVVSAAANPDEAVRLDSDNAVVINNLTPTIGHGIPEPGIRYRALGSVMQEAYLDIAVSGEHIRKITYQLKRGKFIAKDSFGTEHGTGKQHSFHGEEIEYSDDVFYYDTLTVDYDKQSELNYAVPELYAVDTADDLISSGRLCFITGGNIKQDYHQDAVYDYYDAIYFMESGGLLQSNQKQKAEEWRDVWEAYFNELLGKEEMYITVEYTDGSVEKKTLVFSSEWNLNMEPVDMLIYSIDSDNHQAEIVHQYQKYRNLGIILSDTPAYHLGEQKVDTDDDGIADTTLTFTQDDIVHGYHYDITGKILGKIKEN